MLNNYEDAFLWYRENAHRIDGFEFVDDDGTRRPLTNVEMYWLTQIKRAEEEGVDVPTDPQEQLVQVLESMDDDSPDPVVVRLQREVDDLTSRLAAADESARLQASTMDERLKAAEAAFNNELCDHADTMRSLSACRRLLRLACESYQATCVVFEFRDGVYYEVRYPRITQTWFNESAKAGGCDVA